MSQVYYDANNNAVADYPSNRSFTAPKLSSSGIPWMVPKADFFTSDKLNPEWSFLGYTPDNTWSLSVRPGWIRLTPKSIDKPNTIIKTDPEHNYSLITRVDFAPSSINDEAGIRIMNGMENLFAKVFCTLNSEGKEVVRFSFDNTSYSSENQTENIIWLKLVRDDHILSGYYSSDGFDWTKVGQDIDVSKLDSYSADFDGWCGNRQGLYVQGSKSADFDLYIYRDAYTPILAECPANQSGTKRIQVSAGDYALGDINNGDWALYAGVEFGEDDYARNCDSVKITASSIHDATVEVWLDSIGTGKRIASCHIFKTGGLNSYHTFSAKTDKSKGMHDVYLRFLGPGDENIMSLRNLVFITSPSSEVVNH